MKTAGLVFLTISLLTLQNAVAGDWQVIRSGNGSNTVNELHGVSALSENDVWAVGVSYTTDRTIGSTLIQHWNGSQWSVIPSPNPSSTINLLQAVAAVAPNDVWAVGYAPTATQSIAIMHWNGTAWSVIPNPPGTTTLSNLAALAAVSANDVWAVGNGRLGDENATLTLHWNGSTWSVVASPNVGPEVDNILQGVTAISSNDVWAVGTQQPTSNTDPSALILHWNGSAWTIVPSTGPEGSHLLAASAVASNDVWATGYSEAGTLTEHWNGSTWSVVATPTNVNGSSPLFFPSVVALSSANVWTVGESFDSRRSVSHTLTEQWNGTKWAVVKSPNVGPDHNELFAIDATPGGTLWTVGTVYRYPQQRTLIARKLP